ncbi:MAG: alpha/beta hydrolase [Magnetococcales bacterium]|nr:alpha/beta hydrolase [Magnetococcales bacterium]
MPDPFEVHWDVLGDGAPVLAISGFASGNWMFERLLEPLKERFRFILPDNRGMGRSPPAQTPYSLDELVDDLIRLMEQLNHPTFAVIGLSMGGFIAQRLALRHPERVAGLVLMCTSSNGEAFKPLFPMMSREQVAFIYHLRREDRVRAALSDPFCPRLTSRYPEVYDYVLQQRIAAEPEADQVLLQYDAVAGFFAAEPVPLAQLTMPALILSGEQDPIVPQANARLLAEQLPRAELEIIPDTDHLFFLEQAERVSSRIGDFLAPLLHR